MKSKNRFNFLSIIAAFCIMSPTSAALASTVYDWQSWTFPNSQTASVNIPNLGSVSLSVQGPNTGTGAQTVRFDNVTFTPTIAPSAGVGTNGSPSSDLPFSFQIDFTSLSDTSGLILGLGNFGTDGGVLYRLTAFDSFGVSMPLTGFVQIGSYDHTWVSPTWPLPFNDDVSLNISTGIFDVTTIPGGDDYNSDILLLKLGAGIGHLEVSPIGGNFPAGVGGDGINILVASPVPVPETFWLFGSGLAGLGIIGKSRTKRVIA